MASIVTWPAPGLTQKAEPVPQGESCRALIEQMFEAMDYPNGIGIAAPQIGVNKRVICIKVPAMRRGKPAAGCTKMALINPEIIWHKGTLKLGYEGCLSFPGEQVMVPRLPRIKVQAFDVRWNPIVVGGKDLVARVLQHEIDHLNGITLDYYAKLAEEALSSTDGD